MKFVLKDLYLEQAKLDERIHKEHGLDYLITRNKRVLALLVEVGELANETRCFKFWSKKGPSAKEIIIDEFADGMHFYLSIGIDLKTEKTDFTISSDNLSLSEQFIKVYDTIIMLVNNYNLENYYTSFITFLTLIDKLGLTSEEFIEGYYKKLAVNYDRQNKSY